MMKTMKFGRYEFTLRFEEAAVIPEYSGSMLRGYLGSALKSVMCGQAGRDCRKCAISGRCLYAMTFEQLNCEQGPSRNRRPRPYVIEPPEDGKRRYAKGDPLRFRLLLFGSINNSLAFLLHAVEVMGRRGLGRMDDKDGRPVCSLDAVLDGQGVSVFDPVTGGLTPDIRPDTLRVALPDAEQTGDLRLFLKTPLRLKHDNHLQSNLPFHVLIRNSLGRISALFEAFGDGEPDLPYRELTERAGKIGVKSNAVHWHDWTRHSSRQKSDMQLGGMLGEIEYADVSACFLPLLEMAGRLHIGKQTTFGLGRIEYEYRVDADRR